MTKYLTILLFFLNTNFAFSQRNIDIKTQALFSRLYVDNKMDYSFKTPILIINKGIDTISTSDSLKTTLLWIDKDSNSIEIEQIIPIKSFFHPNKTYFYTNDTIYLRLDTISFKDFKAGKYILKSKNTTLLNRANLILEEDEIQKLDNEFEVNFDYYYYLLNSINPKYTLNFLTIYPNPLSEDKVLNIKTENEGLKKVFIYNSCGKLVFETDFEEKEKSFNLPELNSGIFFAKIQYLHQSSTNILLVD